ncbi:uncharacterized protein FIBRA_07920 [Fibroporia radiculosa]|uniref:Glycosyltransferase 61 catalytic domain-containing protein n=1 Tax=Fibroporia radiculosa TaxID=599839 RepID=J4H4W3_9APHY|nr:uncharacterized protein FIBRA_07920 [Fibroporia radiculosa]CCM05689.1 predicted protein [Fibroporia radiculosa]
MGLPRTRSLRDVVLILLGATTMHLATVLFQEPGSIIVSTQVSSHFMGGINDSAISHLNVEDSPLEKEEAQQPLGTVESESDIITAVDIAHDFPETTLVSHAPGWTVYRNLYMFYGTLYIVSSQPMSAFPDIMFVTSTGLPAENTPENIALRMPTARDMDVITPSQARLLWGGDPDKAERNRIWPIEGNTVLINEPSQFLDHYYHFCAEFLLGAWSFWQSAFNTAASSTSWTSSRAPPIDRMIFAHADANGWRDRPGFNAYFLRAAFPSLAVEVQEDWQDRIAATSSRGGRPRAWIFDTVMLTDRSAAFRGEACGSRTQRIAAEAVEHGRKLGTLAADWWEPIRRSVLRFSGVDEKTLAIGYHVDAQRGDLVVAAATATHDPIVVTYISRQGSRRHLIDDDHATLVEALTSMCDAHGWELNVVQAERLSKEEQLALAARTTIMIGVHGNGLTHLIMMPVTPISTVIEIFYPTGFAHDYEWTTHALGMRHFAIWNDTYHSYPETVWPNYPEGFQGTQIPVHAPAVTQLIQDRIAGRLQ